MNLRKYVGHEPIIGLGATTLVFHDNNLPNMESRAKAIIDKIKDGTIKI